jgi:hypothetical protein
MEGPLRESASSARLVSTIGIDPRGQERRHPKGRPGGGSVEAAIADPGMEGDTSPLNH